MYIHHCKNDFISFCIVIENTNVCTYASSVLQKLCTQDWLREKCLRDNNLLFSSQGLLDSDMTDVQVCMFAKLLKYVHSIALDATKYYHTTLL